ncbi:UNVERIFIED_CONTAM: hypothetical protein HDU68_010550 [Siphonaria sp. JEL0065]|nr:hypothetical protein HDU68_010550 [Siphonaria sp. JEL0065]
MASTVLPSGAVAFPELGSLYLAFALCNLFGAAPLVDRIGSRPSMFFAALTYTTFDFSNVIAIILEGDVSKQLAVLLPSAILIGAGAAVLWTAQGFYVIKCATKQTIGRYTGVFFGLTSAANFIGALLTAFLLQAKMDKVDAFKVLGAVGALGPLILIYIWYRPEPSNPSAPIESTQVEVDKTPLFLKAGKIIISKKMLMLAVLVYLAAFEQTFSTGSLALFVKTDSPTDDLRTKLFLAAAYGVSLTVASFAIGPITDYVSNPTLIIVVDAVVSAAISRHPQVLIFHFLNSQKAHMSALAALWIHPESLNNLALLYPVNIICATSDAVLLNQIYKIIAGVFPANPTAYAAYKFHASFMTGICFFLSKTMLKQDGTPNMAAWVLLLGTLFVGAIISTWYSTKDIDWKVKKEEVVDVHLDEPTIVKTAGSNGKADVKKFMMGKLLRRFTGKTTLAPGDAEDERTVTTSDSTDSVTTHIFRLMATGRRKPSTSSNKGSTTNANANAATHRLRVVTVNDVYKMHNLAALATAVAAERAAHANVIVLLPGDFISPSLLSSLDKGFGMIDVLNQVGIDCVCFGNHEDDVDFASLKHRVAQSRFLWVNTNMPGIKVPEELADRVPPYSVIEVASVDGTVSNKKVAILGLCTDDQHLYKPGHFGGTVIESVNGTAYKYSEILKDMDLIVPMTHQDMPLDRNLAASGIFPVIVGGHEHEPFLENINGSQIIKTGIDANQFSVIDIEWTSASATPTVTIALKDTKDYQPKPDVQASIDKHLRAVDLLRASVLCELPKGVPNMAKGKFILSSRHVRRRPCTMGIFLCSIIRDAMNTDCCLINAGTFRGNRKYGPEIKTFTYMDLEAEMPFPSEIAQYKLPGRVINEVIAFSRAPALENPPVEKGGFMQSCDAIKWDPKENRVISIRGEPLELDRLYSVAISYQTVAGLDNIEPLLKHLGVDPNVPNATGNQEYDFIGGKELIVSHFCLGIWHDMLLAESFETIDVDNRGYLTKEEVYTAFEKHYQGDMRLSQVVVDNLFAMADTDSNGKISQDEYLKLKLFCMEEIDFHGHHDDDDDVTPVVLDAKLLEREIKKGTGIDEDVAESVIAGLGKDSLVNGMVTEEGIEQFVNEEVKWTSRAVSLLGAAGHQQ